MKEVHSNVLQEGWQKIFNGLHDKHNKFRKKSERCHGRPYKSKALIAFNIFLKKNFKSNK